MSYRDRFSEYGSRDGYAESRPWITFHNAAKLKELGDVARADRNAEHDIKTLEALLEDLREYRQALAARYAELETMPYRERLELERRPDGWRGGNITYYIRTVRRYQDGTETVTAHESFPGKQRREALKRFEELKKQRPGIEAIQDIAKKSWER